MNDKDIDGDTDDATQLFCIYKRPKKKILWRC